ncbi:protein SLOW GREEN 1, chloroplastic-like [Apium graveolens]|uniref:protein SLOW GREEN 1, chloroplastic-like n=1 Tax=Apium graveolens TaxID=4045 RepID=UPI003D7AC9DF
MNAKTTSLEPIIRNLRNTAIVILFTTSMIGKFRTLAARADNQPILTTESTSTQDDAIDMLKKLMDQKFESGDYEESLRFAKELVSAQPELPEWKISSAMILKQMGETKKAFNVFDQMLSENPLQPEALFQNALLLSSNGQGVEAMKGLENALELAKKTNNDPVIRDVRLVIARLMVGQRKFEEALDRFNELEKEDPNDWRIYFSKCLLFHCTDRNAEAAEQFQKSDELFSKSIQIDGFMSNFYRSIRRSRGT